MKRILFFLLFLFISFNCEARLKGEVATSITDNLYNVYRAIEFIDKVDKNLWKVGGEYDLSKTDTDETRNKFGYWMGLELPIAHTVGTTSIVFEMDKVENYTKTAIYFGLLEATESFQLEAKVGHIWSDENSMAIAGRFKKDWKGVSEQLFIELPLREIEQVEIKSKTGYRLPVSKNIALQTILELNYCRVWKEQLKRSFRLGFSWDL